MRLSEVMSPNELAMLEVFFGSLGIIIVLWFVTSSRSNRKRLAFQSGRFGIPLHTFKEKYNGLSDDELDKAFLRKLYNDWVALCCTGNIPIVNVPLRLQDGEVAHYYDSNVTLAEEQVLGVQSSSVGGGVLFDNGIAVGGGRSTSEVIKGVAVRDEGELCITNRRLMFVGRSQNRVLKLDAVVKSIGEDCSLTVIAEGCSQNLHFGALSNACIANGIIRECCDMGNEQFADVFLPE